MANIVQIKRSSVAGRQPNVANLQVGELAVNLNDGILYTKDGSGDLLIIGSKTTSNVVESGNLYFSNVRAIDAVQPAKTELEVTASGSSAYLFDQYSGNNPTIYVNAGDTIAFSLGFSSSHPFMIRDSSGGSNYNTGLSHVARDGTLVTGSSAQGKHSGVLYFKVPYALAGQTKVYQCSSHGGMVGSIQIGKPTSTLDTDDILEASGNLYYTDARVYANVTNIGFASNSYVNTRVDTKANVTDLNTSNVTEGSNLYFTNTRARYAFTGGNQIAIDANGLITSSASGGGGGSGNVSSVVGATGDVTNTQILAGVVAAGITTANVPESGNLYFTNARTVSALTGGNQISIAANGLITSSATGGGSSGSIGANTLFTSQALTGDGSTTDFNLSHTPNSTSTIIVTLDGLKQHVSEFALTGNVLEFNTAPYEDANIEVQFLAAGSEVTSVGGLIGNVNLTTANIGEQTNLYFTNTRAVSAITAGAGMSIAANGRITSTATGGGEVTVSQYPPGSPSEGDFWIDNQTSDPYIYFDDGNSSQWVDLFGSKFEQKGSNVFVITRNSPGSLNLPIDSDNKVNVIIRTGAFFAQVPLIN